MALNRPSSTIDPYQRPKAREDPPIQRYPAAVIDRAFFRHFATQSLRPQPTVTLKELLVPHAEYRYGYDPEVFAMKLDLHSTNHRVPGGQIISGGSGDRLPHSIPSSIDPTSTVDAQYDQSPSSAIAVSNPSPHLVSPGVDSSSVTFPRDIPFSATPLSVNNQSGDILPPPRDVLSELPGELVKFPKPALQGGSANVYLGVWKRPDGQQVSVAVKVLRALTPTSITVDQEKLTDKILRVSLFMNPRF